MEEEGGGMTRVEYTGKEITVEAYNRTGDILSQQNLPVELPLFGGFYSGEQYNFLVFGQENPEEDNGREVIRVVRYRKDWKRMDDARLLGANTVTPFHTGSLSMVQCGDMLYIRTSHKMYRSQNDGLHHQANLTFSVKISTMEVTDQHTAVSRFGFGYVSHSFNQFLTCRGTTLLAVDHGDAYPRAVVLSRCAKPGGEETFSGYADTVEVLPIQGEIGDNRTGVSVGGLEATATSYLVAGCSVDQMGENHQNGVRNIFVTSTPANDFTQAATEVRWMTSFEEEDLGGASNPYLVKLGEDRLLLLWEAQGELQYGFLDGTGKLQGTIYHASGRLSDCRPVVMEGAVVVLHRRGRAGVLPAGPGHPPGGMSEWAGDGDPGSPGRYGQPHDGDRHLWGGLWPAAGAGAAGLCICRLVSGSRRCAAPGDRGYPGDGGRKSHPVCPVDPSTPYPPV